MHFIYRITFILCIGTFMEFKKSIPTLLLSSIKVVFDALEIAVEQSLQHSGICSPPHKLINLSGDKTESAGNWDLLPPLGLRAPCASAEDLTCHDDLANTDDEDEDQGNNKNNLIDEDATPTPSGSLCSSPSINCGSLAVTPVHHPKPDIDLCFKDDKKSVQAT